MKLVSWSRTDTGRKRDHNEDSILVESDLHLWAVADGMGGHQGGEHASRLALEVLRREISLVAGEYKEAWETFAEEELRTLELESPSETEDLELSAAHGFSAAEVSEAAPESLIMSIAARRASTAVYSAALEDPALRGMGTTLTAMLYSDGKMYVCHAGDSRGYLFRDGQLKQLTEDHSWITEQLKAGAMTEEEAKNSQFRHIITRSVGFEDDVDVESECFAVEAGDCYLLCSDGLSNYIDGEELASVMADTWYRRLPGVLVDMANDRGGDDNISVVVVYAANHDD